LIKTKLCGRDRAGFVEAFFLRKNSKAMDQNLVWFSFLILLEGIEERFFKPGFLYPFLFSLNGIRNSLLTRKPF
jgi:hypothetical protein